MENDELEDKLKELEKAENAIDSAYSTGKVERAKITQSAQLDAAEAVAMAGIAMEADVEADEAMRISVIAEKSGDRDKAKDARKKEREARKKANKDHKAATKSAKRAYDAIKFSAPNKMGFMRVVQLLFAAHIGVVLLWLVLTSRDTVSYNVNTIMDWIMVILEGVAFWMFINRYKVARPLVIGMSVLGLVVPVVVDISLGRFNAGAILTNGAFYIFLILYFALSTRVKATLVNDISLRKGDYEKEDFVINRRGWPFFRNLVIYFIVFSLVGHWMEMGMCQFIRMGLVEGQYDPSNTMLWRDVLYPFPMEGAAVVVIALFLYPLFLWLKKKVRPWILAYVISFIAGALLCTVIELSMGLIVNADFHLWDYRENFGNIMGQVCLQNTLAFGVVAAIITWWIYPLLERLLARVPRDIMNIVFVVIAVFGAIIWSLYLIEPPQQDSSADTSPQVSQQATPQQQDTRTLASKLAAVNSAIYELERAIDGTNLADKDKLKADAEGLRKEVSRMLVEDLGLKEFPNLMDQIITEINAARAKADQAA